MNLNDGLFANCRGRGRGKQSKKSNVITIQKGGGIEKKTPKKPDIFNSPFPSSSDCDWKNGSNITATEFNTSTLSRSMNTTVESDSRVVLAITEGRGEATCEVGISSVDIKQPALILCQISDSQSYVNVLSKINVLNPVEILIPVTMSQSRLTLKIKEQFPEMKITGVARNTFNKANGMQYVNRLCAPAWNSIFLVLQHKYYALTAASALFTYIENHLYTFYAKESIKVEYQESEGFMIIDVFTADKLELVSCALPDGGVKYSSLRGVLNNCVTKIGARTLRASILQPPSSITDIEARLDCVEELVRHPDNIILVQGLLKQISKVDQLLTLSTILPDQAQNCSGRQLNYVLLLNSLFDLLGPLGDLFERSTQPFFKELYTTFNCKELRYLKGLVRGIIHENARPAQGEQGTVERCFAIKTGICDILDIIRTNYSERLDELREYVRNLGEKYNLDLKLANNNKKGYHIVLNLGAQQRRTFKKSELNEEFIQVERMATMVTMKTHEVLTYSTRLEDIVVEILKLSNIMIHNMLIEVRKNIGLFYKLCDDIAKLDMIQSLAKASNTNQRYVRPIFGEFTEIIQGRHPLLDYLCEIEPTANDIFCSPQFNMNIITGPNGSGKSIFIRQIVLLQVMAQVGCFVPAEKAIFRVADRILARIYLEDNMDCGASAFVLEMKEIQYIMSVLTSNSLIIIDELCRSTSVSEGTALAMALCERLLASPAFIFFTTHYTLITKLHDMYLNVKCWQLEAQVIEHANKKSLQFTYRVLPGVTSLEEYAIYLARASWCEDTMNDVEKILSRLRKDRTNTQVAKIAPSIRLKYELESELNISKAKGELTAQELLEKIGYYRRDLEKLGISLETTGVQYICPEVVYSESTSHRNNQQCDILNQTFQNVQDIESNLIEDEGTFDADNHNLLDTFQKLPLQNEDESILSDQEDHILENVPSEQIHETICSDLEPYYCSPICHIIEHNSQESHRTATPFPYSSYQRSKMIDGNKNSASDEISYDASPSRMHSDLSKYCESEVKSDNENSSLHFLNEWEGSSNAKIVQTPFKKPSSIIIPRRLFNFRPAYEKSKSPLNLDRTLDESSGLYCSDDTGSDLGFLTSNTQSEDYSISLEQDLRHKSRSLMDGSESDDNSGVEADEESISYSPNYSDLENSNFRFESSSDKSNEKLENVPKSSTPNNRNITLEDIFNMDDFHLMESTTTSISTCKNQSTEMFSSDGSTTSTKKDIPLEDVFNMDDFKQIRDLTDSLNKSVKSVLLRNTVSDNTRLAISEQNSDTEQQIVKLNPKSTSEESSSAKSNRANWGETSVSANLKLTSSTEETSNSQTCKKTVDTSLGSVINETIVLKSTPNTSNNIRDFFKNCSASFGASVLELNQSTIYSDSGPDIKRPKLSLPSGDNPFEISPILPANKRPKFKTPVRTIKCPKAINKLSKREIQQAFYDRDIKLMQTGNHIEHSKEILNRPSVRQIQASTPLVTAHRTKEGSIIVPANAGRAKTTKPRFKPPLKRVPLGKQFDIQIFSDKNSGVFEEFIKSSNDSSFDFTRFQKEPEDRPSTSRGVFGRNDSGRFVMSFTENNDSSDSFYKTPDGYFKQNRSEIEDIMKKYNE